MYDFFILFRNLFVRLLDLLDFTISFGSISFSFLGFVTVCLFFSMIVSVMWKGARA